MSQQRWDVKLVFLNGPLAVQGQVVLRGPVIRIGARPGPGGFALENYRGIDDRQVTITAYDGDARIAPVGTAQVRLASHEHVNWKDITPLRGETHLSPDCAFHLGPLGRGATVRFVDCQKLGVWEQERMLSAAVKEEIQGPAPVEAKEIQASKGVPGWFIGGLVMIAMVIVAGITVPLVQTTMRDARPLGPEYMGEVFNKDFFVTAADEVDAKLLDGFEQPWLKFVAGPNSDLANEESLREPENFDHRLLKYATTYANKQLKAQAFWKMLDRAAEDYATVVRTLRDNDAPEVIAGIPIVESGYRADAHDYMACAGGLWQFQPEVAYRYDLEVSGCKLGVSPDPWRPTTKVPPQNALKNAPYIEERDGQPRCRIKPNGCKVDQRKDPERSTQAAIRSLMEPLEDEVILNSGAAVQLAITSHNAGYDNSRYRPNGRKSTTDMLHAYEAWIAKQGVAWDPRFLGHQVLCPPGTYAKDCAGTTVNGYAQHYAYKAIGAHFLAVCYYGQNYADTFPEFRPYETFVEEDGYCARIQVPTVAQVRAFQ